ncbi:hypothetical protein AMATHDRAFT_66574 [Amanita thiersii Skay4041]|uniref:HpcH/HpaI aldolase/citrate lyase domain-containing protein n=1 Tax=Amanita thiersii Skay4041 TaxID=703135 RepID=A0A2A9NJK9_9AGAR|nr:hypothetical protein AMATHDRAFT_66574 [Amanita thiersii Skay4041]
MTSHALLQTFKSSKPALGAWLTVPGFFHARTVAKSSPHLSWIMIDCEHGLVPLSLGAAESVSGISAASPTSSPSALVRIPATGDSDSTSWQIKYALDAGAHGLLVPMVSTAEKAREIATFSRFPPVGKRGLGSPFAHGSWGLTMSEYLKVANDDTVVMIQVETKEAVDNLEEIAAVPGIDVYFIGPFDLSLSLGYPPPSPDPHPEVERVIQRILQVSHSAGKKCAIFCTSGTQAAKRAKEGFDMINVTSDTGAMTESIFTHMATAAGQKSQ